MAEKKKSIIEEALLEAKTLEDALKANTKEILAATMRQEIENIVESSLKEEDEEEEKMNDEELEDLDDEKSEEKSEEESKEESEEKEPEEMLDMKAGEELEGMEDMESEESEEKEPEEMLDMKSGDESLEMMGDLEDLDTGVESEEEVIDLRNASDAKVAKVFKLMKDEDEIEVVQDGNDLSLKDNKTGAEYHIQLGESYDKMEEEEHCEECEDKMYEEDEPIYEIELDEDSDMYEMFSKEDESEESEEEEPIEEDRNRAHRRMKYHGASKHPREFSRDFSGVAESKKVSKPVVSESTSNNVSALDSTILKEYEELKAKNEEYKKALTIFKTKLNEVALFNNNLALVTKLFTEHSTTKKEKLEILKKFDSVQSLKESKNLYKTISADLEGRTPLNESVEKKVVKSINTGSTNLNESTAYVDPQINKIKEMMKKLS